MIFVSLRKRTIQSSCCITPPNVFVERLWRTVKYENIYLKDYGTVPQLDAGLHAYFQFYNHERLHQSLDYCTPAEVHFA